MPRSGSTMLQAVLSNNSQVRTVSEPWLCLPFLAARSPELQRGVYNSRAAANAIGDFLGKVDGEAVYAEGMRSFLLRQYELLLKSDGQFVLDKTPRYYEILPQLKEVFPNARIIVLKRHPVGALDSMIRTWNKKDIASLSVFERDLLHAPSLMHDFLLRHKDDPHVIDVRYEDIMADPSKEIAALYEWLGLSYDSSVLDYGSNDQYKGIYGDQKGAPQSAVLAAREQKDWQERVAGTWYDQFARGYADYLGKEFLELYGGYSAEGSGSTKPFRYYKYAAEHEMLGDRFSPKACRKLWWYEKFGIGSF